MHENHGGWYYEMLELGFNYRMTEMQAALGNSQLTRADKGLARRHEIAELYNKAFKNHPNIQLPFEKGDPNKYHAYHLYIIRVPDRKGLYDYLVENNVFVQVHYIPVHILPYYKNMGWKRGDFPIAENYYDHCLSIPMFPTLTLEEQNFVIEKILGFCK
jgi:dTDP-4-amino-4,6-dideoxygalactose transaminase